MKEVEGLQEFYKNRDITAPEKLSFDNSHFNVFALSDHGFPQLKPAAYRRRDFYKISLIRGHNRCHYADKSVEMSGSTLMFFNPQIPYTWEALSDETGFFCIFKEAFFTEGLRINIRSLPMYMPESKPGYTLTAQQDQEVSAIFEKMIREKNSGYRFKYDLLRSHLTELLHFAMKMKPSEHLYSHSDANSRITSVFKELLERQFPIEAPDQKLNLRSAKDFAGALAMHINHLNRAIKETTGKTTTNHIAERIAAEAQSLLKHSQLNISEIGYLLGFEEPAYFYNFFKKQTSLSPSAFREANK